MRGCAPLLQAVRALRAVHAISVPQARPGTDRGEGSGYQSENTGDTGRSANLAVRKVAIAVALWVPVDIGKERPNRRF